MEVVVNVDDAEVRAAFDRLLKTGRNPAAAMSAIGRYGESSTVLRFRNQVGPDGQRWKPSRRVQLHGGQTLRLTGRLRNSITWVVSPGEVAWGTNVVYGAVHQFGYHNPRQKVRSHQRRVTIAWGKKLAAPTVANVASFSRRMDIDARPFLGLNEADRTEILSILAEAVG